MKTVIYLAELAHNGFGLSLNTVPLGIGCVGAYSKGIFKDKIELHLFRQFDDLMKSVKTQPPHIVGFGCFTWNSHLTAAASKYVREACPDALIVWGGLDISLSDWEDEQDKAHPKNQNLCAGSTREYDLAMLMNNLSIDLIVHGDGEVSFSNIVERFLETTDRSKAIEQPLDGCSALVNDQLLSGKPVEALIDLDTIPSPYLMGLFTQMFEQFQLVPQVETVRGCPYKCTYCTIGGNVNKLRRHSLEYIKEEILYLKENSPNGILRIADSNWGILKRDVQLAEFIKQLQDTTGYPSSLRVYYAEKGPFENVRQMAQTLKSLLPLNMSFQTLTDEVLKNIKRKNVPIPQIKEMIKFAHNNGIATSTELISGLPGETYDSFREVFLKTVKLNFDSVYVGSLYLTRGAELDTNEFRELYGLKTMYALLGNNVTKVNSQYVVEADEVVVETNSMSLDDFWRFHELNLFIFSSFGAGFVKELVMHCLNYEITPLEIQDELLGAPEKYEFYNKINTGYVTTVKTKYYSDREQLEEAVAEAIERQGNIDDFSISRQFLYYLGTLASSQNKQLFVTDFVEAARSVYNKKNTNVTGFYPILDTLGNLAKNIIISPIEQTEEEITMDCDYDLVAWAKDDYDKSLAEYRLEKPRLFSLCVRNIASHKELFEQGKGWSDVEKYLLYFSTTVSSNMRRFITYTTK